MPQVDVNGIRLEYDTFGRESDRPLLLVMGLGAQMIHWDEPFCERLADRGHFVVRFDNRDAGLSTKFDHVPPPEMSALVASLMAGQTPEVPYTLDDMADDAVGLLDHLDIDRAHVCGASMGGMIVQTMAIRHPQRLRSMTSIMSTTGNPDVPPATPEAMAALTSPVPEDFEGFVERSLHVARAIGSPGFPVDEERLRARARRTFDRALHPHGTARQMAAIVAHGNRRPKLEAVKIPTLVIHGAHDPLVPVQGGHDTHAAIANSELLVIDGMGHDLPIQTWDQIVDAISRHSETHH
ncbi:MAG: alpha/beta fold hydrolase [Pseudomonadales bacterium]|nr:alpha/beta fold hydrolase [Pseudomonadales bacterium]